MTYLDIITKSTQLLSSVKVAGTHTLDNGHVSRSVGDITTTNFRNIEVSLDTSAGIFWCWMRPEGRPIVTNELLEELTIMQAGLHNLPGSGGEEEQQPFRYYIFGSRTPGIFSLGGDLNLFAACIRTGDRRAIEDYAHMCVDIVHQNATAFSLPVVTVALVQGDALGGGFETALSHDVIVAERSAKMGLPEVLFNLFPGMGAYSFLTRRITPAKAAEMVLSGAVYRAEELHAMGIVDVLAEDGKGEEAVRDYVRKWSRKHNAHRSLFDVKRLVHPVTHEELMQVVNRWVDAVFEIGEHDLRKMARLTNQQGVRVSRDAALAIAAE